MLFSSFLDSGYFCHQLITFANILDGEPGSKPFDALIVFLKEIFDKADDNKSMKNMPGSRKFCPRGSNVDNYFFLFLFD